MEKLMARFWDIMVKAEMAFAMDEEESPSQAPLMVTSVIGMRKDCSARCLTRNAAPVRSDWVLN